jgi:branched-subunit amino acid aminotransferase/4-amino-4-deoxychorismate lyase
METSPFAAGLQFGISVFEGMQARHADLGKPWQVQFFADHAERLVDSAAVLALSAPSPSHLLEGLEAAIEELDPRAEKSDRLYLRVVLFSGVEEIFPSSAAPFICNIFAQQIPLPSEPMHLHVHAETPYVRALPGSTLGHAKAAVNYTVLVERALIHPLPPDSMRLWLSPEPNPTVEELDTMSIGFLLHSGRILVPPRSCSMLPGVSMKNFLAKLACQGLQVEERALTPKAFRTLLEGDDMAAFFATSTGKGLALVDRVSLPDRLVHSTPDAEAAARLWSTFGAMYSPQQ